jgi:TolB-like protein
MKKLLVIAALLVAAGAAFGANPKVAVLDAVLPEKMDKNVAIGVTEKISEELVNSGRFMVLDRTTVAKTLEEIEFQMSGLVSDEDIRKAGDQLSSRLGAAFVVTARVSQVGDTFFVSAKMVDIKTGEITAQASDESEGKIAITLKVAQNVGRKLAAGVKESEKELVPAVVAKPKPKEKEPEPVLEAEPAPKPVYSLGATRSRITLSYSQPVFFGETEMDIDSLAYTSTSYGLAMRGLTFVWKGLYIAADFTAMLESASDGFASALVFEPIFDLQAGAGWGFTLGKTLQLTAGFHAGYGGVVLGDYWGIEEGDSYGGLCFGGDVGLDLLLGKSLVIGLRADVSIVTLDMGGGYSREEGWVGAQLGVGWAF